MKRSEAKPYRHNPRKLPTKSKIDLQSWLAQYGDISGIVYNRTTQQVVAGNQRSFEVFNINECEIELVEQYEEPDEQGTVAWGYVIWQGKRYNYREVEWDLDTEKQANIIANKAGGEWDKEVLADHWTFEELSNTGWKKSELKWLNEQDAFGEKEEEPVEERPETKTSPKDVYQLNEHRIICGSATEEKDYSRLMKKALATLTITDPPYNVDYKTKAHPDGIENDNMKDPEFRAFLFDFYTAATQRMTAGAPWYVFHADSKGHIFRDEFIRAGNYLAQCLIWEKDQLVLGRNDYHWLHEPCLFGGKPDPEAAKQLAELLAEHFGKQPQHYLEEHEPILYGWVLGAKHTWATDRSQTTVLKFPRPKKSEDHPTMKPVPLIQYLINNRSEPGGTVLDPFAGSGTTLIATEEQNKERDSRLTFYGMEIDPHRTDKIIRRWIQWRKNHDLPISIKRNNRKVDHETF